MLAVSLQSPGGHGTHRTTSECEELQHGSILRLVELCEGLTHRIRTPVKRDRVPVIAFILDSDEKCGRRNTQGNRSAIAHATRATVWGEQRGWAGK